MRRSYGGLPILLGAFLIGVYLQVYFWYAEVQPASSKKSSVAVVEERAKAVVNKSKSQGCERYSKSVARWCDLITKYSKEFGVDPDLIAAVITVESAGNPDAISHSGAVGLMQIMPKDGKAATFMCPNGPCFKNRPSTSRLKNPDFNVMYGTRMLSGLIKKYGLDEGLKRYGPMDVGSAYANKVLSVQRNLGD